MKKLKLLSAFIYLVSLAEVSHAQASKRERRAMLERGTDSAWVFFPALARPRFYLGTTRVSHFEFENTLVNSDPEVAALVTTGYRKLKTSRYISIGSFASLFVGLWLMNNSTNSYYSYRSNDKISTTSIVLVGAGLVAEGVSIGFHQNGSLAYRRGIGIFNLKAKSGQLNPPKVELGTTNNGVGLSLRF